MGLGDGDRKCVMVTMSLVGKECRRDRVCDDDYGSQSSEFRQFWGVALARNNLHLT